jgi:hypothetical protein
MPFFVFKESLTQLKRIMAEVCSNTGKLAVAFNFSVKFRGKNHLSA